MLGDVIRYRKGSYSHIRVCPTGDREQFIRDNAVSLVEERDALIKRLRKRIRQLEASVKGLKGEAKGLKKKLVAAGRNDEANTEIPTP